MYNEFQKHFFLFLCGHYKRKMSLDTVKMCTNTRETDKAGTVHAAKCYDQLRFSANEKRITFLVKPLQNPHSSHDISTIFSC